MSARGSVVGRARVVLDVDKRRYDRDMHDAEQRAHHLKSALGTALRAGAVAAAGGFVALGFAAHASIKEFQQAEQASAQTKAVIESTGGAAHVSAKHVTELSNALLKKTGIDDEVVQSGENMLLTFRNIRNEVGKGNDIFDQATVAGLDMSKAMEGAGFEGGSLKTTMIRLGKALNDPITGMTALRRVGVTFSKAQQDLIKHLETTGHHLRAQKIILRELRAEFGGSAVAAGKTFTGQLTILRESLTNFGASIVAKAVPALTDFFGWLDKIANAPDLKIKLQIAGEGIADFGRKIGDQLGRAVRATDWSEVGREIGTAVGAAITFSDEALNGLLSSAMDWLQGHAGQFAELGLVIGLEIINKLGDPGFWLAHWQLIAIALLTVFGGRFLKIGGDLIKILARGMGGEVAALADYLAFTLAGKLPPAIGRVFLEIYELGTRLIGRLVGFIGDELGKVPGIFAAVFKISIFSAFVRAFLQGVGWIISAIDKMLGAFQALAEGLSHIPFIGDAFRGVADKIGAAREKLRGFKDELDGTHGKKIDVDVRLTFTGRGLTATDANRDGLVAAVGDGTIAWIRRNPGALMPPASATGSAAGLKPMILDDLALGRSYGLTLTSGYRPGAVTSSGHRSLHAVGQAIDMAGSPQHMAMYAQAEAGRSGIAEVIYSPVGWWHPGAGWGPVTDPTIKAAHYSHVHVGARSADGLVGAFNRWTGDGRVGKKRKPKPKMHRGARSAGERKRETQVRGQEELPANLRLEIANAHLAKDDKALLVALRKAEAWYVRHVGIARNVELKIRLTDALAAVRDEIASVEASAGPSSELPAAIEERIFLAEDTPGTEDDVIALEEAETYLLGQLQLASSAEQRLPIRQALRDIRSRLTEARGQTLAARTATEAPLHEAALLSLDREYGSNVTRMPAGGTWSTQTGGKGSAQADAAGGRGDTHVHQYFTKPPEDNHPLLRSAKFAAEAVFGS
jgi:hypothetical protein